MDVPEALTLKDTEAGAVTVLSDMVYDEEIGVQAELAVKVAQLVQVVGVQALVKEQRILRAFIETAVGLIVSADEVPPLYGLPLALFQVLPPSLLYCH